LLSTDSFASKTKIIPLNRKHSQVYHSGGFPFLAQLLIYVLLWFRFKSDLRLGEFRIFIGKPAYLERVEYWRKEGETPYRGPFCQKIVCASFLARV